MMAEQKGRGGKKPKYQIADIGGSDLTPQDLSTERVLNFLIKGENPADQGEVSGSDGLAQANSSREDAAAGRREPTDASLPSSGAQGKKSLDHLFQRASAGGGGAKDLKLALRSQDEAAPTVPFGEMKTGGQAQPPPIAVQAEGETGHVMRPAEATATEAEHTPPPPQTVPSAEPEVRLQTDELQKLTPEAPAETPAEGAELSQLISLWKSFYRLKDGEIEALSALYQMSHGLGTDECYVKMQKLAVTSNLTYRYCQKIVRSLEQLGWITKVKDYDPTTQLGVLYRVNLKPSV